MNRKYEGYFSSEADGLKISVMAVLPQTGEYKAVLQLSHGISEYKERYLPFMEYMADLGYICVIHDHRGHGKSVREKNDLGYMYEGGVNAIIQDIRTVNRTIHEYFPNLPIILFGHSMGSLAVRAYAAKYDHTINMLIVCGSPFNNPAKSLGKMIACIEKKLRGGRHRSSLLEKVAFGKYSEKFKNDKACKSWLCSDPKIVEAYERSEMCGSHLITDDEYITLFDLMKEAYNWKKWNCNNKNMPILFVAGADDPCIGNVRKFSNALQIMRHAGYVDVKGKLYPGMRHEILNEVEKELVYHDIATYIKKKGF